MWLVVRFYWAKPCLTWNFEENFELIELRLSNLSLSRIMSVSLILVSDDILHTGD